MRGGGGGGPVTVAAVPGAGAGAPDMCFQALRLADAGFRVFRLHAVDPGGLCTCGDAACSAPGKHPFRGSTGCSEATRDPAQIAAWWALSPTANIGIATGGGLVVIDVDGPTGEAGLAGIGPLPATLEAATSRGRHLYFSSSVDVRNSASRVAAKVDVRGTGGYVVAPPSLHMSGVRYAWRTAVPIAPLPDWLAARAGAAARRAARREVAIIEGGRNDALTRLAGRLRAQGLGEAAVLQLLLAENAERCRPPLDEAEVAKVAGSAASWGEGERAYFAGLPGAEPFDEIDPAWEDRLRRKPDRKDGTPGGVVGSVANLVTILGHDPGWRGCIGWDELGSRNVLLREPPWHADDRALPGSEVLPRPWSDADDVRLSTWFERSMGGSLPVARCVEAVSVVARRAPWHPVRAWLESLQWDGRPRLARWLHDYAGAELDQLSVGVGHAWLVSAVARIFEPGCQADYMLILEGDQGARKSSTLRALLPDASWFSDTPLEIGHKDALQALRGKWLVEMGELSKLRAADVEAVKIFLSSRRDDYRPSYARAVVSYPRQCVFAGTVNTLEGVGYLADPSGARRFWPIRVKKRSPERWAQDRANLEAHREQIWAEAVVAYRRGAHREPSPELDALVREAQDDRAVVDAWEAIVVRWLRSPGAKHLHGSQGMVTIADIAQGALQIPKDRLDRSAQTRIGVAAAHARWVCARAQTSGARQRGYMPPTDWVWGS